MNINQKIVRALFYTEDGLRASDLKAFGSKNPWAVISNLKLKYHVNVQRYIAPGESSGRYYVPPTEENIHAIRAYLDPTFNPRKTQVKEDSDFKTSLIIFIAIITGLFLISKLFS